MDINKIMHLINYVINPSVRPLTTIKVSSLIFAQRILWALLIHIQIRPLPFVNVNIIVYLKIHAGFKMDWKREVKSDQTGTIKEEASDQVFDMKIESQLENLLHQIGTTKEENNYPRTEMKSEILMETLAQVYQQQQTDDKAAEEAIKLITSKQQFLWDILQLDDAGEYGSAHSSIIPKEEEKTYFQPSTASATSMNIEETSQFAIKKWECFNLDNFDQTLETIRIKISRASPDDPQLTSLKRLFWKLRHYRLSSPPNSSRCPITYGPSPQFSSNKEIGRVYANSTSLYSPETQQIGLQSFPNWIRAGLAGDFYWNLKITNAHPSLLLGILDAWKVKVTKYLQLAVSRREKILADIVVKTGLSNPRQGRKLAEELLTILFYGGSVSLWRRLNNIPLSSQNSDNLLLGGLFDLDGFSTEMRDLSALLWNSVELVEKEIPYFVQIKRYCVAKFPDSTWKQKSCFLSLFLQTEERKLLALIEAFMLSKNRYMDVYAHNGGLIRKLKVRDDEGRRELVNFDILHIEPWKLDSFTWERQFPVEIVRLCEKHLESQNPKYAHIKLQVEEFDKSEWKSKVFDFSHSYPPIMKKTFEELLYYYEEKRNLCFVKSEKKYFWEEKFLSEDLLKGCYFLPDRNYVVDALAAETDFVVERDPIKVGDLEGQTSISQRNLQNFWKRYSRYQHRKCFDKIIFGDKESELFQSNTKPTPPKQCSNNNLILYKGHLSFNISQCHPIEDLYSKMDLPHGIPLNDNDCDYSIKLILNPSFGIESPLFSDNCLPFKPNITLDKLHMGRAACFFNHMYLLCDKREEDFVSLIKFVGKMIQTPTMKEETCGFILCSKKDREGHLLAAEMIKSLVSPFWSETTCTEDIFNPTSALQERCLLLHWIDDYAATANMFSMLEESLEARNKAKKRTTKRLKVPNSPDSLCRFLVTTRSLKLFPFSKSDKCWTVISCSNALSRNKKYYESLREKWTNQEVRKSAFLVLDAIDLNEIQKRQLLNELNPQKLSAVKRFMIGVAFWLKFHLNKSPFGQQFEDIYSREINSETSNATSDKEGEVFWISSQDLFTIFSSWCLTEPGLAEERHKYTVPTFRQLICKTNFKDANTGISCVPIYINHWIAHATKMGLNLRESAIQLDAFMPILNQLSQNLPLKESKMP